MPTQKAKSARNPERTQRRILEAALHEFAVRGFAGARVDAIARRADSNKRMLYHYFTDKEGLFRAVLRHKVDQRMKSVAAQTPDCDLVSSLPVWFKQNCLDADWVRLLAWESLQTTRNVVLDEKERRRLAAKSVNCIREKQKSGRLRNDVPAQFLQLAKVSLSMFPFALPQIARLFTGQSPSDPKFQKEYTRFLETISTGFRPSQVTARAKGAS